MNLEQEKKGTDTNTLQGRIIDALLIFFVLIPISDCKAADDIEESSSMNFGNLQGEALLKAVREWLKHRADRGLELTEAQKVLATALSGRTLRALERGGQEKKEIDTQQATAASADRNGYVSSGPLEKKKAKKGSSNSTQEQAKEKNKSRATKCALQRKVSSKDGHFNRCLIKKMLFRAMLVLGVCFTYLFSNLSSWYEIEISCFISSSLLPLFPLILIIL